MDVDTNLNDSLVLRRRSSRRCHSLSGGPGSIKKEEEEASSQDESQGTESEEGETSHNDTPRARGRKRKRKRPPSLVKHGCVGKHRMILRQYHDESESESFSAGHGVHPVYEKPLRRSKREKRLLFATFNVSKMDKQILNPGHDFPDIDLSEEDMDPYEKLLSPRHVTRKNSRQRRGNLPSVASTSASKKTAGPQKGDSSNDSSSNGDESDTTKDKSAGENGEGGGEGGRESEEQTDEDEEVGGYYNLRKRQPVIYHFRPVHHHIVEDDTPPKKRRRRRSRSHASYHTKARSAAPRAYSQTGNRGGQSPRKRQAHHDSSSTSSSDSDSDEAKFRHRKARSMAKSRSQCLPMNFTPEDLAQGIIRDRIRIGASLADVNPMNVDRSVTFASIGGLKQHIRALKEMIIFPLLYPEVFDRFQINPPRGVLFHGPPGCGKTLVARALANECSKGGKKVAFFMRKGADCLSKWVGESERQLRLLFDQAYQVRPSIIFFDEIDGLAPVRSSRQDQIHSSIVSTLLALMDGLDSRGEIVVIGATNRIDAIDPALRRPGRFDREFVFPLPSRMDRHSILSINTKGWNPKLKDDFLSELAEKTVGYCGADLQALCTEVALFALRRQYPQIYSTPDKLVLDITKINVAASDFHNALKSIVPTAQRLDGSVALALPEHVRPLFLEPLSHLLNLLCFIFPPSWKLVFKASSGLEALMAAEKASVHNMELKFEELKESLSPSAPRVANKQLARHSKSSNSRDSSVSADNCDTVMASHAKKTTQFSEVSKRTRMQHQNGSPGKKSPNSTHNSTHPHHNHSDFTITLPRQHPTISNWVGGGELGAAASKNNHSSLGSASKIRRQRHSWSSGSESRSVTNNSASSFCKPTGNFLLGNSSSHLKTRRNMAMSTSMSSAYSQLLLRHSTSASIGSVFFDLTEISDEDMRMGHSDSILVEGGATQSDSILMASHLQSMRYLNFSSHPHAPPAVHQPRLVLTGQGGMGQSSYLGPALLHALEEMPVRTMDLSTLFGSSSKTPEEACAQTLHELKRVTPSILYLPRLDSWWDSTPETFQMTFLSSLFSLLPSTPILVLATAECLWEELPPRLKEVFVDSGSQSFSVGSPSLEQRKQFFYEVLLDKPFQPPPPKPRLLSDIPVEDLPVASPPKPRELSKEELSRVLHQREAVLRELRVFLRDATNKLLAERKFKEFVKPVDPEVITDYFDIIAQPMDLSTVMKKIDDRRYTIPKQWIMDVDLIAKNALEYNPEDDSESKLLRHRAVALQDMAHSFLDHELSEDFEKQCEDIEETYERVVNTEVFNSMQLASSNGNPYHMPTTPSSADGTLRSELYDAPRRSLRQKGVGPEGDGFPYYSPSKPRIRSQDEASANSHGSAANKEELGSSGEEDGRDSAGRSPRMSGNEAAADTARGRNGPRSKQPRCGLTNAGVRRQIIRPWEDKDKSQAPSTSKASGSVFGSKRNGMVSPPSNSLDSAAVSVSTQSGSVQTAAEALVAMATPTKGDSHGHKDDLMSPNSDELNRSDVVCNGSRASSCSPKQLQVTVDGKGLLEVYERIVIATEGCSVELMERVHTTYQQLVFRHRMSWQRESLLEDLRFTTDLFIQELGS